MSDEMREKLMNLVLKMSNEICEAGFEIEGGAKRIDPNCFEITLKVKESPLEQVVEPASPITPQ